MNGESIVLVKGISGSGKSTRVYLFLDFLKSLKLERSRNCLIQKEEQVDLDTLERNNPIFSGFS
jgi:ABC-type lipoprotein export system ATPase subunit